MQSSETRLTFGKGIRETDLMLQYYLKLARVS